LEAAGVGLPRSPNSPTISRTRWAQSARNDRKPRCRYKTGTADPPPSGPNHNAIPYPRNPPDHGCIFTIDLPRVALSLSASVSQGVARDRKHAVEHPIHPSVPEARGPIASTKLSMVLQIEYGPERRSIPCSKPHSAKRRIPHAAVTSGHLGAPRGLSAFVVRLRGKRCKVSVSFTLS
jgi:hypothetical protein